MVSLSASWRRRAGVGANLFSTALSAFSAENTRLGGKILPLIVAKIGYEPGNT